MSQLIPDNTFLAANNNDNDDIYGNSWMSSTLAAEGEFTYEGPSYFGYIQGNYDQGLPISFVEGLWNYLTNIDITTFAYFLFENKLYVYLLGQDDVNYAQYSIESNVDNLIALDSSKVYNLSYQLICSYFNTDYTLSEFNITIELLPTSSNLNPIIFNFSTSNTNVSHVVENTIYNPPTGNYQVRFTFTLSSAFYGAGGRDNQCIQKFEIDNVSLTEDTSFIPVPAITDIEGNTASTIGFNHITYESSQNPADNLESLCIEYPDGWTMFGVSLKLDTLRVGHDGHPTKSSDDLGVDSNGNYDLVEFLKNHLYANENDSLPIFYHPDYNFLDVVIIAKNNGGNAYLPAFDFNGIGNINQFEGYQVKFGELQQQYYLKYEGEIITDITYTWYASGSYQNNNELNQGWNMLSFPGIEQVDVTQYLAEIYEAGILIIVKDYNGNVWLPEWNFNGIGNLKPGFGYQMKIS
tara:strand:- start:844 stop:2238 length:1395 start_codon:yes stop_codon:yes gene_type:complete